MMKTDSSGNHREAYVSTWNIKMAFSNRFSSYWITSQFCMPIYNTQQRLLELILTQILGLMASLMAATLLILLEKHTSLR